MGKNDFVLPKSESTADKRREEEQAFRDWQFGKIKERLTEIAEEELKKDG